MILKVLADGEGMSLTELAEASGQAPATVYRVLSTFAGTGWSRSKPATQLWFVGQEAFRIGSAFLGRTSLVEQARGVMHALMAETGEAANLAIADGGQVVFISRSDARADPGVLPPGTRGPIHASGIGKALLAYHAPEAVARIVRDQGLAPSRRGQSPPGGWRRSWDNPGAWLGGRRRRADRGDALHRGADLQRVPRGDRRVSVRVRRSGWSGPAARRWCRVREAADRITRRSAGPRHDGNRRRLRRIAPGGKGAAHMTVEIVSLAVAWSAMVVAPLRTPVAVPVAHSSQPRSR